eukprot:m.186739 g.186739  ORF g.186739 m.186739 type:complete len:94 (-) comp15595_c2_seq1:68-349(-)
MLSDLLLLTSSIVPIFETCVTSITTAFECLVSTMSVGTPFMETAVCFDTIGIFTEAIVALHKGLFSKIHIQNITTMTSVLLWLSHQTQSCAYL